MTSFGDRLRALKVRRLAPSDLEKSLPQVESAPPRTRRTPPAAEHMRAENGDDHNGSDRLSPEEWKRIQALPVRTEMTPEGAEAMSYEQIDARAYEQGYRLRLLQADILAEFGGVNGLLAQARVGTGKTLSSLMMCSRAAQLGIPRQLLLVPASVYRQLMEIDLPRYRKVVHFSTQFHGLGGMGKQARLALARRYRQGCFVVPYSVLSRPDCRELLDLIDPGFVCGDEAQYLKNRNAARTKRFLDFANVRPKCLFAFMSGTLTSKSILDYHHLARLALRERCPLPLGVTQANHWAQLLDAGSFLSAAKMAPIQPLRLWAKERLGQNYPYTPDGFREAYQQRLATAPDCVMSSADELDVGLSIEAIDPGEPGTRLKELMDQVVQAWLTPMGDEISHAFHMHKWLYELSAGFYYELVWPKPRDAEHGKRIEAAKRHHAAQNLYNRALRGFLQATSRPGLDTPMLVGGAIHRGETRGLPRDLVALWKDMKALEFEGMPEREQRPIRVDQYKMTKIAQWVMEKCNDPRYGGIIWFHHNEPLEWAAEHLRSTRLGDRVMTARAGDDRIMDPKNAGKIFR